VRRTPRTHRCDGGALSGPRDRLDDPQMLTKRKPFNVTLIHPSTYVHSLALKEAADYIHAALVACGYPAARTVNQIGRNAHNIIFCAHMLGRDQLAKIPADSIIFNSEQLEDTGGWHFRGGAYQDILSGFCVWDYSPKNLSRILHDRKSLIPFRHRPELLRSGIPREHGPSLLFYGIVTPRRKRILDALQLHGVPVEIVFGEYGDARDAKLRRAWAVLNLHKSEDTRAFEPIRCFYALINEVPVISEETKDDTANEFRDCVFFFDQAALIESVKRLYADPQSFTARSRAMLQNFKMTSPLPDVAAAVERFFATL